MIPADKFEVTLALAMAVTFVGGITVLLTLANIAGGGFAVDGHNVTRDAYAEAYNTSLTSPSVNATDVQNVTANESHVTVHLGNRSALRDIGLSLASYSLQGYHRLFAADRLVVTIPDLDPNRTCRITFTSEEIQRVAAGNASRSVLTRNIRNENPRCLKLTLHSSVTYRATEDER